MPYVRPALGPFLQFSWLVFLPGVAAAVPPSRERESLLVHLLSGLRSPSGLLCGCQWSAGAPS